MSTETPLLLALDFTGTLVFALNGALTAVRAERLDIFGVITLGMFTGLGGGTIRDVLLDALPPATFLDWHYLALAAGGGLIAFILSRRLERLAMAITVLDAVGLSVFAVLGANKALSLGFGVVQALIVGTITAVGGGTIRDVMIRRIPTVLSSELYAIPALIGAGCAAAAHGFGYDGTLPALGAAAVCFVIRMIGVRFDRRAGRPVAGVGGPRSGAAAARAGDEPVPGGDSSVDGRDDLPGPRPGGSRRPRQAVLADELLSAHGQPRAGVVPARRGWPSRSVTSGRTRSGSAATWSAGT